MNVMCRCMSWVQICWRGLLGLFYTNNNNNSADDLVKPFSDSGGTVNSLDNLDKPDDYASELSVIDNPLPTVDDSFRDPLIEQDHLHTLVVVDKPHSKPYVDLPDLPDSIVEDILSRLPPKCILQCQRHSKALHALTKTSYSAQIQRNWSKSVTVVQRFPESDSDSFIELYFIDEDSNNIEAKTTDIGSCYKSKGNPITVVGSYDGFLLFTNFYEPAMGVSVYYLWNPVTDEKLTWGLDTRQLKYVCGFYFCSVRREYVLLLVSKMGSRFEVQILNIRTKLSENIGYCFYPPSPGRSPVIINRTLYWMVDEVLYRGIHGGPPCHSHLIVSFEMETDRFIALGHSGRKYRNELLHLIELQGELCICDPIWWTTIELSVLNEKTKCWVKRHTVILPRFGGIWKSNWPNKILTEVVNYKKGELFVRQLNTLYAYNLRSCTYRIVDIGFSDDAFQARMHVDKLVSFGGVHNSFLNC